MTEVVLNKLNDVNVEVDRLLSTSPLLIRKYTQHLSKAKGKGIRALSVLTAALDENEMISDDAIYLAAAIEILHLATLVHDDVMDDADTRRGIVTLHKKYGRKTAIICGDYLLALAMNQMSRISNPEKYSHYNFSEIMLEIALGELNQHLNNGNLKITVSDYYKIIRGKTAKLFEASFYSGAMTHLDNQDEITLYKRFGDIVGMIFQITDDCIDFEEDFDVALKPTQSDYEQGVITLPLIHALSLEKDWDETKLSREIVNQMVVKHDGVGFAKRKARHYYQEALEILEEMTLTANKRKQLKAILNSSMRVKL